MSGDRKVKANWTFPVSQINDVEDVVEDSDEYDSESQFVREAISEKLGREEQSK